MRTLERAHDGQRRALVAVNAADDEHDRAVPTDVHGLDRAVRDGMPDDENGR